VDVPQALRSALADRYAIEREVGAGGMATVYVAHDLRHDRQVALKVLHPELAAILGAERFLQEIRTTAHLQHPHILPLFDSGEAAGLVFYVMPYVAGESLRQRLGRETQLPLDDAVRLTREVANAIDYAHRQNVIHRDLKPENILLQDGTALVADFGIALAARRAGGTRLTETGLSLGTPSYMSPEQATAEREIDGRSDVYALGAMLYEMLVGEPPFTGPTTQAIIAKLLSSRIEPPSARRPTVPAGLDAAVLKALERLPADRHQTAGQFAEALGRAGEPVLTGARAIETRRPRLRRVLPWAVAAVSLAVAIGVGLSRSASKPDTGDRVMTLIEPPEGYEFAEEFSLALSPDGRQLAFVALGPDGQRSLWLRPLETLGVRRLPGTEGAQSAFWSPDSRQLGFFARDTLYRLQLASSAVSNLCAAPQSAGGAWSRDGTIVFAALGGLFRATPQGTCVLALSDSGFRPDGVQRPLFLDDGARVVFSVLNRNQLHLFDLQNSTQALLGRGIDPIPADRDILVFGDGSATGNPMFAQRVAGSPPRLLGEPFPLRVSVAGASGNLSATAGGRGRLIYLEWMGDRAPRRLDRSGTVGDSVNLPSGNWTFRVAHRRPLLASGGDVSGFWLTDLARNLSTKLDIGTGAHPVFSPDDRRLAYWSWGVQRPCGVRVYDLERRSDSLLLRSCRTPRDWSPDGRTLLLGPSYGWVTDAAGRVGIVALDLLDGSVRAAENIPLSATDARYSPDGRWIAYESAESGAPEIYVTRASGRSPAVRVSTAGGSNVRWRGDSRELFFLGPMNAVFAASVVPGPSLRIGTPRLLFRFDGKPFQVEVTPNGQQFLIPPRYTKRNAVMLDGWLSEVR
jgi:serine/threonine protein kinase/Tol biopolymer transport system component